MEFADYEKTEEDIRKEQRAEAAELLPPDEHPVFMISYDDLNMVCVADDEDSARKLFASCDDVKKFMELDDDTDLGEVVGLMASDWAVELEIRSFPTVEEYMAVMDIVVPYWAQPPLDEKDVVWVQIDWEENDDEGHCGGYGMAASSNL